MLGAENWFESIYSMGPVKISEKFPYLGSGISRAVYALNNYYVVKVAMNRDGLDQCMLENKIFLTSDLKFRKYICPVLWYRTGMIIMPRALPLTFLSSSSTFEISSLGEHAFHDLKQLSRKYNLLFDDIESISSWGMLYGKPVLIDYGCTN